MAMMCSTHVQLFILIISPSFPTVFDPDGYLRLLLGGPARLMQTKPPSETAMAALKALYDWRDRVR